MNAEEWKCKNAQRQFSEVNNSLCKLCQFNCNLFPSLWNGAMSETKQLKDANFNTYLHFHEHEALFRPLIFSRYYCYNTNKTFYYSRA